MQPLNADLPITETNLPIFIEFKDLFELKAPEPILITLSGIMTDPKLLSANASVPICSTEFGIVISDKLQ